LNGRGDKESQPDKEDEPGRFATVGFHKCHHSLDGIFPDSTFFRPRACRSCCDGRLIRLDPCVQCESLRSGPIAAVAKDHNVERPLHACDHRNRQARRGGQARFLVSSHDSELSRSLVGRDFQRERTLRRDDPKPSTPEESESAPRIVWVDCQLHGIPRRDHPDLVKAKVPNCVLIGIERQRVPARLVTLLCRRHCRRGML
jgi:hypothetical protein